MKRISSGTVTVFVMAIVVGLVAAFVVKQVLAPKPQAVAEAPKERTIKVVVATKNLTENQVVKRSDVRVVDVPASRKPKKGALSIPEQAHNRILKQTVKAGQAINDEMLHAVGDTLPGLEERVPVGMVGMPIKVSEQSIVAKMVNVGSRVDVSLTVEGSHPDLGEMATQTLLHNVEVIAVEKPTSNRRGAAINKDATITVAVSKTDANRIINAEGTGKLDLMLCSANGEPVSTGDADYRITRRQLLGLGEIPAPPKPFLIEKWEGGSVRQIKISPEQVEESLRATAASKKFGPGGSIPVNTDASGVKRPAPARNTIDTTVHETIEVSAENDEN